MKRLNYANVIATLALFLALGGTGYAVTTIDGSDVQNGSLTGADIQNSSLSGKDVKTGSLQGSDVQRNSLDGSDIAEAELGTVPNAQTVDGTEVESSPLVKIAENQSAVLLRQGPFTFTAYCLQRYENQQEPHPAVFVQSSEPGELQTGTPSPFIGEPEARGKELALNTYKGAWSTQSFSAVTASGARAFGLIGAGAQVFGSDCAVSFLSLGTEAP
jgi:hypothetical protein